MAVRPPFPFCLFVGLALLFVTTAGGVTAQDAEKSIFVTVINQAGRAVRELAAADFALREDGQEREIVSARLSGKPLQVALLVDSTGGAVRYVQPMRAALKAFVDATVAANPESAVALWTFGERPRRINDFTSDAALLGDRISGLFPASNAGSLLLDAIHQASESLARRASRRRAIVVLNVEPADEQSEREPRTINDSLARSGAQIWTLSLQIGVTDVQRGFLLRSFTKNAGGVQAVVVSDSALTGQMRAIADLLNAQYELTYRRPGGAAKVVETGIRREGLQVVAGLFAPR